VILEHKTKQPYLQKVLLCAAPPKIDYCTETFLSSCTFTESLV